MTVAPNLVRKTIVAYFEPEEIVAAAGNHAKYEIGFGQTVPATRLRGRIFDESAQSSLIGRIQNRKQLGPVRGSARIFDKDVVSLRKIPA